MSTTTGNTVSRRRSTRQESPANSSRIRRAALLGLAVLASAGVLKHVESTSREQAKQAALTERLARPIDQVREEVINGEFDPDDITIVKVDKTRNSYKEAVHLVPDGYEMGYDLPRIIREQVGETAHKQDYLVVPAALVPHRDE